MMFEGGPSRVGLRCERRVMSAYGPRWVVGFVVADWGHKLEVQFLDGTTMDVRDDDDLRFPGAPRPLA